MLNSFTRGCKSNIPLASFCSLQNFIIGLGFFKTFVEAVLTYFSSHKKLSEMSQKDEAVNHSESCKIIGIRVSYTAMSV